MSADLQSIARFLDPVEAELARARLEEEGLNPVLTGDLLANLNVLGYAASGIDLSVPAAEQERAVAVLADYAAEVEARKNRPKEAITAAPPPPELMEVPLTPEEAAALPNEAERLTERAYRASLAGFLLCSPLMPALHVYALLLLLRVTFSAEDVRRGFVTKYYVSFILCALSVGTGLILAAQVVAMIVPVGVAIVSGGVLFALTLRSLYGTRHTD